MRNPFNYFKTSPEIIRLAVMMYVRYPLSVRQVEDLLHERVMTKFRSTELLQKFVSIHATFHNNFNKKRHLNSANNLKVGRAAARDAN